MKNVFKKSIFIIFAAAILGVCAQGDLMAQDIHIAIIDSGATGYVDYAKSFTSFSAHSDPLDHGTHVAKLIRSRNPNARISMLQVCEKKDGELKPSRRAILEAVKWAVANDIDIVNMSLVTKYDKEIENAIIDASTSHGIIFVAAAGNKTIASRFATDTGGYIRRVSKSTKPAFPASSPHVISVGAVDEYGNITNYSDKTCDVYAKGKILGQEGTSFSSARITARVTKILSDHPTADTNAVLSFLK